MNFETDIIIVGASSEGIKISEMLSKTCPEFKVTLITKNLNTKAKIAETINVVLGEVTFTNYRKGLFGCYLSNNQCIFSRSIIFATGVDNAIFKCNNRVVPNAYFEAANLPKTLKEEQAIVFGDSEERVKLAIAVAKKARFVYLCTPTNFLNLTAKTEDKLRNTENIVWLPRANCSSFATSKDGHLRKILLDTYAEITCSAVFPETQKTPATKFIAKNLFPRTPEGYLKTSSGESSLVPFCFAIGKCVENFDKKILNQIINYLKENFK